MNLPARGALLGHGASLIVATAIGLLPSRDCRDCLREEIGHVCRLKVASVDRNTKQSKLVHSYKKCVSDIVNATRQSASAAMTRVS